MVSTNFTYYNAPSSETFKLSEILRCEAFTVDTGLQEPAAGTNTTSSNVTHHICPDDGGRDSLQNTGL
jgi:hypothetical protein